MLVKQIQKKRARVVVKSLFILLLSCILLANANQSVTDAYLPTTKTQKIVPEPQQITLYPQSYTLPDIATLNLLKSTPALENLVAIFKEELAQNWQVNLSISKSNQLANEQINIGLLNEETSAALTNLGIEPVSTNEGYVLHISPAGIIIIGSDEAGVFYGLQSLRQLLRAGPQFQNMTIRDYPDLPLRIAMVYLDSNSSLNTKLLPLLAEHKFNALLVMSNYICWESAPELRVPGCAPKELAKQLVNLSKINLLQPIPLLETLGHVQWMFNNNQHRDLLADPTVGEAFAYDPLNPNVYELLFPVINEVIELFEPKIFHIGHDEVRNVIPFPGNEAQRQVGFARLFLDDTLTLYNHLAKQNIQTMMWHDILLSDEIVPILDEFPKDIMVASWNYEPATTYPSLEHLQTAGFQALGATWAKPENITSYAKFTKEKQASGMIQTRWSGYFGNSSLLLGQYNQAYAYLNAANIFWNTTAKSLKNFPQYFRDLWLVERPMQQHSGTLIDLSPYATRTIDALQSEEIAYGWLGRGESYDLSGLLAKESLSGFKFLLNKAISLKGSHRRVNNDPEEITVPLNLKASSLVFLHTTGWSVDTGTEIGSYLIHFVDGSTSAIPLRYGQNISAWTDNEVISIELNKVWQGKTRNDLDVSVDLLIWDNPKADIEILGLELQSNANIANPILLGLTVMD